ncbi:MAG: hypothetical protein ACOZIN_16845 [Myxococcota bacterium]
MPSLPRLPLLALASLALVADTWAQSDAVKALEELDPDAKPRPSKVAPPTRLEKGDEDVPPRPAPAVAAPVKPPPANKEVKKPSEVEKAGAPAPKQQQLPPPLRVDKVSDDELSAGWEKLRAALTARDLQAMGTAQAELLRLKEAAGASNLDGYATSLVRAADARRAAEDAAGTVELALAAAALAPDLPLARFALARAYFFADVSEVGRYLGELRLGLWATWKDPRHARSALGNLGAALLVALVATAVVVTSVLFLRRSRYFFHDFHHLFPQAAARWQTTALALLLLGLPLVLRLGLAPALLALFAASALYLSKSERVVAAVLLSSLGAVPVLAGKLAHLASFAGTPAEDVYRLERGGVGVESIAARFEKLAAEEKLGFAELFALGRYELRRGRLEEATAHFQAALSRRTGDARALVNLGNAMFYREDLEGALAVYEGAAKADPTLAAAPFNLAKLRERRAVVLPPDRKAVELDFAHSALSAAKALDPALGRRPEPSAGSLQMNGLLLSPGLSNQELGELTAARQMGDRVQAQIAAQVLGLGSDSLGLFYPLAASVLLVGWGFLGRAMNASKVCQKCGRAVCRRCDPELGAASTMCAQCMNVFALKGVAAPPLKVRKQIEVARYHSRRDKLSYLFGLLCSGAGHLFLGLPVRGSFYVFLFLFAVAAVFLRDGLLRAPYGELPATLTLAPLLAALAAVYLFSLVGLYKRQA